MVQPVAHDKLPLSPGKSGCPINMTIELLGDRWSLIVLRDIMFGGTHLAGASIPADGVLAELTAAYHEAAAERGHETAG